MTSLKGLNYAFRLEVIMALRQAGYTSAFRPQEPEGGAGEIHGDVLGVTGCTIAVRNQRDLALAEAMNEVEREAMAEGNELYVSVQRRRAHPVELPTPRCRCTSSFGCSRASCRLVQLLAPRAEEGAWGRRGPLHPSVQSNRQMLGGPSVLLVV